MRYMKANIFDDFSCIGSDCDLTCCGRWEIEIDKASAAYYNNVKGEFGKRLKNCIAQSEDGESHFVLRDDGLCPLLNDRGLCDIYSFVSNMYAIPKIFICCRRYQLFGTISALT